MRWLQCRNPERNTQIMDFEKIRYDHLMRLNKWLIDNDYEGIILTRRDNFAWLTAGVENSVTDNTEVGVCSLAVSRDTLDLFADSSDLARFAMEGNPLDAAPHLVPWYTSMEDAIAEFIEEYEPFNGAFDLLGFGPEFDAPASDEESSDASSGKRPWVSDTGIAGTENVQSQLVPLRMKLCEEEIDLYREVGRLCAQAVETTCREAAPGESELEVAARLKKHCLYLGIRPDCVLVGADDRISSFRHPMPTDTKVEKILMVVLGGCKYGLYCSLTRFVCFGEVDPETKDMMQRNAGIFAAMQLAMKDGLSYAEYFEDIQYFYEEQGIPYGWAQHHQGGPTGYACREFVINRETAGEMHLQEAFAWNPSLTGTKCEDTTVLTDSGIEILTDSGSWPRIEVTLPQGSCSAADILYKTKV